MIILFFRTIIVYSAVIISLRLMGKRQIGELQPSELVVAIMISDIATMPLGDVTMPLLYGIVPVFTLVICEVFLSFLSLKSQWVRIFVSGKPQLLVKNGVLQRKEMLHSRVNTDDLMEELRKAGYFSLNDVHTVILETGGSISVIPCKDAASPSNGDLKIEAVQEEIPYIYVSDGKLRKSELRRSGKNEMWVEKVMKKRKINSIKDIFILSEDGKGNVFIQKRGEE